MSAKAGWPALARSALARARGDAGPALSAYLRLVAQVLADPRTAFGRLGGERPRRAALVAYAAPLAAIWPLAGLVQDLAFGAPGAALAHVGDAVLQYGLWLCLPFLLGFVIEALAPQLGARSDPGRAAQVAAYAPTALWLAGAAQALPVLTWLSFLGCAALWTLHHGLAALLRPPPERAVAFTGAVALVAGVAAVICVGIASAVV